MHSREGIIAANCKKTIRAESNFDHHCSFSGDAEQGVVLHSAKLRNTVFLPGSLAPFQSPASRFLDRIFQVLAKSNKKTVRGNQDALIESYFE